MARSPAPLSRIQAVEDLVRLPRYLTDPGHCRECGILVFPAGDPQLANAPLAPATNQDCDGRCPSCAGVYIPPPLLADTPADDSEETIDMPAKVPLETIQEAQDLIDGGMAMKDALAAVGISSATFYGRRKELADKNGHQRADRPRAVQAADVVAHARQRSAPPVETPRQNGQQSGLPAGWGAVETAVSPPGARPRSLYAGVGDQIIRSAGTEWARIQAPNVNAVRRTIDYVRRHATELEVRQVTTADGCYLYWRLRPV